MGSYVCKEIIAVVLLFIVIISVVILIKRKQVTFKMILEKGIESLKTLWEEIQKIKVINGLLLIACLMPCFIVGLRTYIDGFRIYKGPYDSNWLSFFGSYLGGLLGGVATLIAVVRTIDSNKEEQDRKEKTEKEKEIQKSALIVYYDFSFAFENIKVFLNEFCIQYEKPIKDLSEDLGDEDISNFNKCKVKLDQFYFDYKWIHTVANLYVPSIFESGDIETIYEIYGHLSNIKLSLKTSNPDVCKKAFRSMKCLIYPYEKKAQKYNSIMEDLKKLASIKDDQDSNNKKGFSDTRQLKVFM